MNICPGFYYIYKEVVTTKEEPLPKSWLKAEAGAVIFLSETKAVELAHQAMAAAEKGADAGRGHPAAREHRSTHRGMTAAMPEPREQPGTPSVLPSMQGTTAAMPEPREQPGTPSVLPSMQGMTAAMPEPREQPGTPSVLPSMQGMTAAMPEPREQPGTPSVLPSMQGMTAAMPEPREQPGTPSVLPSMQGMTAAMAEPREQPGTPSVLPSMQGCYRPAFTIGSRREAQQLQQEQVHYDTTQHEHYKMRDESQAQRLFSTTPNHNSLPSFFFFASIPLLLSELLTLLTLFSLSCVLHSCSRGITSDSSKST
ncbi:nascent polypeptide-associated complex subunit alpha, muscle-specific form-like [Motacilla alba alba]|uniref:nascent polypeptide-associated complex subunit alpha, muscle-specific form-like n=1 Tax=Motacilla alba alba TaxID=1094192 RepID=UPI0018D4FB81|nr:nascent polypeptide-associated complex subunit alpha, muscle-specific form-like [Motacilla alba alba]XP_038003807.1 nascent polypeptide-associated complex subunit alpha, muscle-specific form-like [Motacilla alba alba]